MILADVFLEGGRNVRLPTTAGRSIQFFGGHCTVVDGRDMPHVLHMEQARVFPRPGAMAWAPEWLSKTDAVRAQVQWPEGWTVEHTDRSTWRVDPPLSEQPPEPPAPVSTGAVKTQDMTDRQPWIRPEDLLEGPDEEPTPPKSARRK